MPEIPYSQCCYCIRYFITNELKITCFPLICYDAIELEISFIILTFDLSNEKPAC